MAAVPRGTIATVLQEPELTRRALLGKIDDLTKRRTVSYLANPNASPNFIDHNDPVFFNDILEAVGQTEALDLILDSPGGDANVAEKLAVMCREFCKEFRVIVPNAAKSAATMLALASDEILMGYMSEMGPIDPQIRVVTPQGQITYIPAQSIIDSIVLINDAMQQGVDHRAAIALIQRIDPPMIDVAQKAIAYSQQFAEQWLSKYMLRDDPAKAKAAATALADNRRWLSHGRRIGLKELQELGVNVVAIPRGSELWKFVWEYYSRARIMMNNTGTVKLFETKSLGLQFGVQVRRPASRPAPPSGEDAGDLS